MIETPDEDLVRRVIDCASEVHRELGPGLDKDIYETCLTMELDNAGLAFDRGRILSFVYNGHMLDYECAADIIVGDALLLQIEAVDELELAHEQRLRTCLYMAGVPVGLLMNFNVMALADGVTRMAGTDRQPDPEMRDVFDDPEFDVTDLGPQTP